MEQKKRPRRISWRRRERALANLSFEVEEDTFEVGFVEDLFALRGAQEEGTAAEVVDLAARFSPKPQRVVARVSEKVLDAVTPGEIGSGPPPGQWRREWLAARRVNRMFADVLVAINSKKAGWCVLEHPLFVAQYEKALADLEQAAWTRLRDLVT